MITVLVADDHAIVRDGLKQILARTADLVVGGEARNAQEVMRLVRERDWDLLLMDMSMPGRSGIDLIKQVRSEKPKLPILVLSMHQEHQYAVRAIRAGACGYLNKDSASELLVSAIHKVVGGGVFVSETAAELLARETMRGADVAPHTLLSDREFQVFSMIVQGKTVTDIAAELSLSVKTVSTHKTHVLEKMKLANQAELVRYAIAHRLLDDPAPPAG
ncbi:MAG TPA: response regulator transcription factor [Burkholderiales bacterium]|nr:response regulator transcription factor [Burkholderiales bacterium]